VRKKEFQMTTATLKSKGRITIPAEVRHHLKVGAGDRVEFIQIASGRYELVAATQSITDLKGMFVRPTRKVSIDDMNKAIAKRTA
jgi:AbrB family looped-hinge helix DNA binding protein